MRKQDTKKAFQDTKNYFLKCSPQRFCTFATAPAVKQKNADQFEIFLAIVRAWRAN